MRLEAGARNPHIPSFFPHPKRAGTYLEEETVFNDRIMVYARKFSDYGALQDWVIAQRYTRRTNSTFEQSQSARGLLYGCVHRTTHTV